MKLKKAIILKDMNGNYVPVQELNLSLEEKENLIFALINDKNKWGMESYIAEMTGCELTEKELRTEFLLRKAWEIKIGYDKERVEMIQDINQGED